LENVSPGLGCFGESPVGVGSRVPRTFCPSFRVGHGLVFEPTCCSFCPDSVVPEVPFAFQPLNDTHKLMASAAAVFTPLLSLERGVHFWVLWGSLGVSSPPAPAPPPWRNEPDPPPFERFYAASPNLLCCFLSRIRNCGSFLEKISLRSRRRFSYTKGWCLCVRPSFPPFFSFEVS